MNRFYIPKENVSSNKITIEGQEAHHILDVMRMRDDDQVVVFDGTGNEYTGFIKKADRKKKRLIVEVIRIKNPPAESVPEVTLAQAIPKKGKMDYVVEKATELGAAEIIPLISTRTVVRPNDSSSGRKIERWKRIALESSKQCGRTDIPLIERIAEYHEITDRINEYDIALFACLKERTVSIKDALKNFITGRILIFIGPEGDFTSEEIQMATRDNCRPVSLGKRVLRSDTAGIFVLAVLNSELSI